MSSSCTFSQVRIYNPPGFDPDDHLPAKWHKWSEHVRHVVYTVWQRHAFEHKPQAEWVCLQSVLLARVLPERDYARIMYALEQAGIVECKRNASGNKIYHYQTPFDPRPGQSAEYRLGPDWQTGWKEYVLTDNRLLRKLHKMKHDEKWLSKVQASMKPYFLSARLDCTKARAWASEHIPDEDKLLPVLDNINQIEQGDTHYKGSQWGRLFHNFTNLKRKLRPLIYFQDVQEPVTEVDIANSQPYFLCTIIDHYKKHGNLEQIKMSIHNIESTNQTAPTPPTICDDILGDTYKDDYLTFRQCCIDGDLYEVLGSHADRTRHQVKKALMPLLFGKSHWGGWLQDTFQTLFPSVLAFIRKINRTSKDALSHYLNLAESNFIFEIVSRHLLLHEPFPFLTVHDSFLVPVSRRLYVERLVKDSAEQTYGYSPRTK